MTAIAVLELLRPGLLADTRVLVAGLETSALTAAVSEACGALGARVATFAPDAVDEEATATRLRQSASALGGAEILVNDAAGLFAAAIARGDDGVAALRESVDASWNATRAVARGLFLPGESGGRAINLAPPPDAGPHADAARAALVNVARTLSIEWARHAITTVTISPGAGTDAGGIAALVAYLASPAGAYFSGCELDLRGPLAAPQRPHGGAPADALFSKVQSITRPVGRPATQ